MEVTGHYRHPPPLSDAVVKCIFPVQAKKTFRLELFAPPVSVHFSVQLSWLTFKDFSRKMEFKDYSRMPLKFKDCSRLFNCKPCDLMFALRPYKLKGTIAVNCVAFISTNCVSVRILSLETRLSFYEMRHSLSYYLPPSCKRVTTYFWQVNTGPLYLQWTVMVTLSMAGFPIPFEAVHW